MKNRFILFLIFSSKIFSKELNLNEILKRVESNNPDVRIKELDIKIKQKAERKAFKNLVLPPITIGSENDLKTAKNEGFGFEKIEAVIPVFQGGKMINTYRKSKKELELAKAERKMAIYSWQEVSIKEYFNALNYAKQKEITDITIETLKKQYNRIKQLYEENQQVAKSEVLKIEADLKNNIALNFENSEKERSSKDILMHLLGYDLNQNIILSEFNSIEYLKSLKSLKPSRKLKDTTFGKSQGLMVDLAEYDLKISKSELYPTLYVKPSHKFREENLNTHKYETVNEGRVEVGLNYTFAWGGTLDSINQSEYKLDQAKIEYDKNLQGLELDIKNKVGEIRSLAKQSDLQKERVKLLRENLKIDNLKYENDLISTFDYLNSLNQLKNAEENFYKLQKTLVLSIIEYTNLYR